MKIVQQFHEESQNSIWSHSHICGKQLNTHAIAAFHHISLHQFQNLLSIHQYQTLHKIQVEEVHKVGILNEAQIPCQYQLQFQVSDVL